ncbi:hypothetical protein [Roseibium marinum]|uniref:Uncharacterized protein n=1 Tax=Roseibium marinum TaxID=281252 RepID=A0A2S3V2W3_9HYPH|nr:hypothetical protein [Roseibium marinum]POF34019.1 hypothetical protein CLV41_101469 [Roseibium marinum]
MNRIVRKHFPVDKLPEELREGLPEGVEVTVTLETELETQADFDKDRFQDDLDRVRATLKQTVSLEEATHRIRDLRDEWDD